MKNHIQPNFDKPSTNKRKVLSLFVFHDQGTSFAVIPESVMQVSAKSKPTPLPFSPDWLDGVVNIRGEILPVIDLSKYFQLEENAGEQHRRQILLNWENNHFIVWSSHVTGLEQVKATELEPPMENLPRTLAGKVEAQFRLDDRIVYVLDLSLFLNESKERVSS